MSPLVAITLALHLIGMALVVGTFFAQMRSNDRFSTGIVLIGAVLQLVSGGVLLAVSMAGGREIDHLKIGVHMLIGVVVLAAAIGAQIAKSKGRRIKPWFHTAGGLGFVNLLIAVLWQNYS